MILLGHFIDSTSSPTHPHFHDTSLTIPQQIPELFLAISSNIPYHLFIATQKYNLSCFGSKEKLLFSQSVSLTQYVVLMIMRYIPILKDKEVEYRNCARSAQKIFSQGGDKSAHGGVPPIPPPCWAALG